MMFVLNGCSKQPSGTRELSIAMQRTACYGTCPVYSVEIYDDLSVIYVGEKFVPLEGEHIFKIPRKKYNALVSAFTESGFFGFANDYTKGISDLSTTYVEFRNNGKAKKIRDYYGAPAELKDLEKLVEQYVEENIWKEPLD